MERLFLEVALNAVFKCRKRTGARRPGSRQTLTRRGAFIPVCGFSSVSPLLGAAPHRGLARSPGALGSLGGR